MYFYLKEPKSDKTTLIYLIYYLKNENKNFKYSTGQKIISDDWDFNSRYPKIKRGGLAKKSKQISLVLDNYKSLLEDTISEYEIKNQNLTRDKLKSIFDNEFKYKNQNVVIEDDFDLPMNITKAIDVFINAKKENGAVTKNWLTKYNNLRKKIFLFDIYRKKETTFDDLNENWLDAYCGFLRNFPNRVDREKAKEVKMRVGKTGYNDNTLQRHIVFLFTFLTWAENNYSIRIKSLKNPVKEYDTDDISLTRFEIEQIEKLTLDREALERARDIFLIGVYSGQRFSDYSVFEKADVKGGMIIKKAEKTAQESFIPLHSKLVDLLEKYNWNIPVISSQNFNPHIKDVCRLAGIDEMVKKTNIIGSNKKVDYYEKWELVGSHTARRTFITLSSEQGMPDHVIMKITGIKKAETLTKYKKTNQATVKDFMNKIWG